MSAWTPAAAHTAARTCALVSPRAWIPVAMLPSGGMVSAARSVHRDGPPPVGVAEHHQAADDGRFSRTGSPGHHTGAEIVVVSFSQLTRSRSAASRPTNRQPASVGTSTPRARGRKCPRRSFDAQLPLLDPELGQQVQAVELEVEPPVGKERQLVGPRQQHAVRDGLPARTGRIRVDEARDRAERKVTGLVACDGGLIHGVLEQPGEVAGHDLLPRVGRRQHRERLAVAFAHRRHGSPQGFGSALAGETRVKDDQGVPQRGADQHELGEVPGLQCPRDTVQGVTGPDPVFPVHLVRVPGVIERDNISPGRISGRTP